MAKKPVKKPVRKKRAPPPKETFLSDELLARLSRDGYCFDRSHEEDVKTANGRAEAAEKQILALRELHAGELKAAAEALQNEVHDRAERIFEMEQEKERLLRDLEEAQQRANDAEAKLAFAKDMVVKELKEANKCFDIMHKASAGKLERVTSVDLIALARQMLVDDLDGGMESLFIVVPPSFASAFSKSKMAADALVDELVRKVKESKKNSMLGNS